MDPLVTPTVPDFQHGVGDTVAKIVGATDLGADYTRGFSAMAQANAQRKQLELQQQKLDQTATLQQGAQALQSQKLDQAMELGKLKVEAQDTYHKSLVTNAQARLAAAQNKNDHAADLHEARTQFNQDLQNYGLTDPNPDNPVKYWANAQKVKDKYQWVSDPVIKTQIKAIDQITNEHTIPLKQGGMPDSDDPSKWKFGNSQPKHVPVGQVVSALMDPKQQDVMAQTLQRNGFMDEPSDVTTKIAGQDVPTKASKWKTDILDLLKQGQDVDFSRPKTPYQPRDRSAATSDASGTAALPAQHQQALQWAQANADDPRASAIMQRLNLPTSATSDDDGPNSTPPSDTSDDTE